MNTFNILLLLCYSLQTFTSATEHVGMSKDSITYLQPEEVIHVLPETQRLGFFITKLRIYCYRGQSKSLPRIFQTVHLHFDIKSDDFTQYEGTTPEMVQEHYEKQTSIFHYFLSNKKTRLKLNPFNQTCIGIDTIEEYRIKLHITHVDFWKIITLTIGILTFVYAANLSHNAMFYYLSGILLGIFASLLVVIYFTSKLIPRRPMMYGVVICGWSLAIYLFQVLWENIQVILVTYQTYVLWYIVLTGFISFVICYRFGPPENQRSRDLIKWGLQLASLVIIFYSSEFQEATCAFIILILISYYFPRSLLRKFRSYYVRYFPPKPRLLTSEEYFEQGVHETAKALDELRKYASSPDCKQWRVVSKLKDPLRFATFVEGSSHISDQEILDYETSRADLTDSELSEENDNDDGTADDDEGNGVGRETINDIRRRIDSRQQRDDEISEDEEENDDVRYRRSSRITSGQIGGNVGNGTLTGRNRSLYSNFSQVSTTSNQLTRRSYRNNYSR